MYNQRTDPRFSINSKTPGAINGEVFNNIPYNQFKIVYLPKTEDYIKICNNAIFAAPYL